MKTVILATLILLLDLSSLQAQALDFVPFHIQYRDSSVKAVNRGRWELARRIAGAESLLSKTIKWPVVTSDGTFSKEAIEQRLTDDLKVCHYEERRCDNLYLRGKGAPYDTTLVHGTPEIRTLVLQQHERHLQQIHARRK